MRWFAALAMCAMSVTSAYSQTPVDDMSEADLLNGKKLFRLHCARCHGMQGGGGEGSNLARPRLRHANDDQELFDLLDEGIPGTGMPAVWVLDDRQLWQVTAYVRSLGELMSAAMPGDPVRGQLIYDGKGGCPACHIANGRGKGIGPELTYVGDQRGAEYLRASLIAPATSQPKTAGYADYLSVRATTENSTVVGMRINEDAFTIQIRDLSGRIHSFRKNDLIELEKSFATSLMPEYGAILSDGELDDVVSYLMSLRSEP